MSWPLLAMPPDDAVDDLVDPPDGLPVPSRRGQRQIVKEPEPAHRAHEVVDDHFERFADDVGFAGQVGAEERLGDDRERQMCHVFVRVANLAVVPGFEHALGLLDHDRRVALDLLALKCGLSQSYVGVARRSPSLVKSPSPTKGINHRVSLSFMKLSACDRKNIIDMFGIHEHVGGEVAQPQVDDVAVFSHGRGQEAELIAQIRERAAQEKTAFGPRGQLDAFCGVR